MFTYTHREEINGSIRNTQDYKKLNAVTIKDAYPLPNISNMFCKLSKARIFTKLDLTHGYWQIMLDEASRQFTAFACELGFYQFKVLPMGLTNACATFQRMMGKILKELIGVICFVYLDDVIIFSENMEEHIENIKIKEAEERQLECADANGILEDAEIDVEANRSVRKLRKRLPVNYKKQL